MDNTPLTEALFYILLAVRTPNHGYGIIQDINEMTGGRVALGPGTLYGAINSMLTKGWIRLYSEDKESRKKKEYLLTSRGMEVFQNEVQRLQELICNAQKMEQSNLMDVDGR
ncbi:PadR family transcriptional regulator [Dehalobacter sp. DCM]|nr:PadR family transcriptional regulator [Dehalobacter sp. DCM]